MGLTGKSFWKMFHMSGPNDEPCGQPLTVSLQQLITESNLSLFFSISEVWPSIKSYKAKRFLSFLPRSHYLSCNLSRLINLLFGVSSHFPFLSSVVSQCIFLYADKQLSRIGSKKALTCVLSNCSYTLSTIPREDKGDREGIHHTHHTHPIP